MSEQPTNELLERVLQQQNQILEQLATQKAPKKDFYDRLTAMAPLLSAAIIALTGAYFTYSYNEQQLHLQQIQTIEKFFPHLVGDEKSKRAAILAMNSLGNARLAARVASIFASEGTAAALTSMAKSSDSGDKEAIREALYRTLDTLGEKYRYDNKVGEAVETYKKAIDIKESMLGKDNPALRDDLDRLADLYQQQGDKDAAEQARLRAAALGHPSIGLPHAQTAEAVSSAPTEEAGKANPPAAANDAFAAQGKRPTAPVDTAAKPEGVTQTEL